MSAHAAADVELTVAAPHAADVAEVRRLLRVGEDGLTADDARARHAVTGPNLLPEPKRRVPRGRGVQGAAQPPGSQCECIGKRRGLVRARR
ncbi:cation-transporting P-type ATPase [Microbacterium sp. oral taxon 186]|uniref:cation-transporting P-type ATPase n=1 Tax=Microbacterium sp. oral taxon 186 TaxID=712383 RepID=UPI000A02F66A